MKAGLARLLLVVLSLGALARADAGDPAAAADPRPQAVWFYADWCMNCKLIAPKLKRLQPRFEERVRFVKLDLTADSRREQNRELAAAGGFLDLYVANRKTGWVALLDSSGAPVGELKAEMSLDELSSRLEQLAGG